MEKLGTWGVEVGLWVHNRWLCAESALACHINSLGPIWIMFQVAHGICQHIKIIAT